MNIIDILALADHLRGPEHDLTPAHLYTEPGRDVTAWLQAVHVTHHHCTDTFGGASHNQVTRFQFKVP